MGILFPDIEEWKPIQGYEGYYEASSHGRIRSLERKVYSARSKFGLSTKKSIVLKQKLTDKGYYSVCLSKDGNSSHLFVARLVAMCFVPGDFSLHVLHLDRNPLNNHYTNLKWGTHTENMQQKWDDNTMSKGETHGRHKLTEDQVRTIRSLQGIVGQRTLAKQYGVTKTAIQCIIHRRTWSYLI